MFKKMAQLNTHPMGGKPPNLVTLPGSNFNH
jgi:hypothetical protein